MKLTITIAALLLFAGVATAQPHYTGYSADNANGYTGSYTQPAAIVNSVLQYSVTMSFAYLNTNNYLGRNGSTLSEAFKNQKYKYKDPNSPGYEALSRSGDILGGHYEINHNNAIGYNFRVRQFSNVSGLPTELTKGAFTNFDTTTILNSPVSFKNLNVAQFIFNEHRFNYARVIFDRGDRMLKAGVAFKILNGIDAVFLHANNGSFEFPQQNSSYANFSGTDFQYGTAEKENMFSSRRAGYGLDLGAVYEYRPNREDHYYDMDGKTHIERFNEMKYKYKIGASITDIGRVRFSKDPASYNFTAGNGLIDTKDIYELGLNINLNDPDISLLKNFDNYAAQGTKSSEQDEKFNMNLPTMLNLQFDYFWKKDIYFNYTSSTSLRSNSDPTKSYHRSLHTFTPRIEKTSWSFMVPITFQRNATINVGLAGRIGLKQYPNLQVFMGGQNVNNWFGARARYTRNFFIGVVFSQRYTVPSDKDGDKISDEKDECPYDPGLASLNGCPDSDTDGIPDKRDYCIYSQGPLATHGCPDTDGDGIIDLDDQCPNDPGLAIHYGCPDKDRDGVIDVADRCPDVPGIELNNGCPFENPGCCMDNDGDGVSNNADKCPDHAGSVYNNGCPIDSTNLNKVNLNQQKEQKDPNHTNQKTDEINKANPKAELQDGERITKMIDRTTDVESMSIYFNHDDATVQAEYDEKIMALAKKYDFSPGSKYRLILIGHTDNDGSDAYNLILSKKRAEVVRRKFEGNKVDYDLIKVYYFGENRPMKSNDNDENKRFNRRVEVIVQKVP